MGRGRAPRCDKSQVIRGPRSPAEDLRLICYIQKYGHDNWRALPKQAGLLRCGKSCRLRWINYLRPDLKRGNFTAKEEETIIKLHESIGNKWSKIAAHFRRTDNEIKKCVEYSLEEKAVGQESYRIEARCNQGNICHNIFFYYSLIESIKSQDLNREPDPNYYLLWKPVIDYKCSDCNATRDQTIYLIVSQVESSGN